MATPAVERPSASNVGNAMLKRTPGHPSSIAQRLEHARAQAFREDRSGLGIPVPPALARELERIEGTGRPLPGWLADQARCSFGVDFAQVRIHAGQTVDRLSRGFQAAAFCVGNDIFLSREALWCRSTGFLLDVLCHELAHIANAFEPALVRCWKLEGHERLTIEACHSFSKEFDEITKIKELHISKERLIEGLKIACSNMDYRQRALHPLATSSYLLGYFAHIPFLAKGEGPRHGEGLNYQDSNPKPNMRINFKKQMEEIQAAVKGFKFDRKHDFDDWIPTAHFRHVALNEKEWVKSLGNALHTAQDRAAHREGRKNFGHSDPRVHTKHWDPDDFRNDDHEAHDGELGGSWWICNVAAFQKGFNNSCQVLEDFFKGIGLKFVHQAKRRPELHKSAGTAHTLNLHGCPASVDSNAWWQKGCFPGEPPGPTGWS